MHIHVHHHADPAVAEQLERLNQLLERFMSDIDDFVTLLTTRITAQKTQVDGIAALLTSIKNQLADALRGEKLSPEAQAKLAAIMPALEANTTEISDAIVANTDAAPPAPTPAPDPIPSTDPVMTDLSGDGSTSSKKKNT